MTFLSNLYILIPAQSENLDINIYYYSYLGNQGIKGKREKTPLLHPFICALRSYNLIIAYLFVLTQL